MSLSLIDRLSSVKVRRFVAPIPAARNVYIFTQQDGIAFRFEVIRPEPGWFVLQPSDRVGLAEVLHEVTGATHMFQFLDQLPKWTVMALFPSGDQRWAVCPFNKSDAKQRGWTAPLRHMHLVRGTIHSGSVVTCCDMAGTLLFHSVKWLRPNLMIHSEARAIVDGYLKEVEVQKQAQELEERRLELEERRLSVQADLTFEQQLAVGGARLISLNEGQIEWEHEGAHYEMEVAPDGTIISTAYCLSDDDIGLDTTKEHNLVSIVAVMKELRCLERRY